MAVAVAATRSPEVSPAALSAFACLSFPLWPRGAEKARRCGWVVSGASAGEFQAGVGAVGSQGRGRPGALPPSRAWKTPAGEGILRVWTPSPGECGLFPRPYFASLSRSALVSAGPS